MTGATTYAIDIRGLTSLQTMMERAPDIAAEELASAAWQASMYLEREVKDRTPVVHNLLRASIGAKEPVVLGHRVVAEVGTTSAYALPVELGSRPHWAPLQPLIDWASAKLGLRGEEAETVGRAIQRKIAHHGTKGQFMFRDAFAAGEPTVRAIFDAALVRMGERIAEAGR